MKFKLILLLFIASSSYAEGHDVLPGEVPEVKHQALSKLLLSKYQFCQTDKECVLASNGCCGCKDVAVAKAKLDEFEKNFSCDEVDCAEPEQCKELKFRCYLYRCTLKAEEISY